MRLAKNHVDVGVYTNQLEPMLEFWQGEVGLPFEEVLPVGNGVLQHRHGMNGSVFKLNHSRDPLPDSTPTGYRDLIVAREGIEEPTRLQDPDGNRVTLVPKGWGRIDGIAVRLGVRDEAKFHNFYGHILHLAPCGPDAYRCGDSVLTFSSHPSAGEAGPMRAVGFRYLTIQVWDVDLEHAQFIARGATEGMAPVTLGSTARISFVRDPDGNWIEISQRSSLTGDLPG